MMMPPGSLGFAAVAVSAVAAVLAAAIPRSWLGRIVLLWLVSPVFVCAVGGAWELATRPDARYPLGTLFYGLAVLTPVALPIWLAVCLAGFTAGFGIRFLAWLARPRAAIRPVALPSPAPTTSGDRTSPDGTIRVELAAAEWANSHWVHSPRVTNVASGRIVLDLWNTDWDAAVLFPAPGRVSLDLRRYSCPGTLVHGSICNPAPVRSCP